MPRYLRLDPPGGRDPRRWAVGIHVSSGCARLEAALVTATGRGLDLCPELAGAKVVHGISEATSLYAQLASGSAAEGSVLQSLRGTLAEAEAAAVAELTAEAGVGFNRVLVLGVHDPGLWQPGRAGVAAHLGLCDPAKVAELTGMNVVDGFADRDLAQGGLGGPVAAVAQWLLLASREKTRVLLDLGRSVRLTYLPAAKSQSGLSRILSFDVGPGMRLLDLLTHRLTGGQERRDPGGRLAVQGRRIDELVDRWLADPYFERPLPRWHPQGVRPERFLTESLQMALENDWSIRDLLCSATHLIAETILEAIRRRLPGGVAIDQVLLGGGGQHNGMLLREIASRLPEVSLVPVSDVGMGGEGLDAASVAVLALMFLDQVPGNPPAVTGADVSRVLGRITPGSPQVWQRLLHELTGSRSSVRPLRSAI